MAATLAVAQKNTLLNAYAALFNSGTLVIYAGTPPANADAALSSNPVLATVSFAATAFPAASNGSTAANPLTQANATATGTATFYRCFASNGTTVLEQGTVGTTGADLNLNTTAIVALGPTAITGFTLSM